MSLDSANFALANDAGVAGRISASTHRLNMALSQIEPPRFAAVKSHSNKTALRKMLDDRLAPHRRTQSRTAFDMSIPDRSCSQVDLTERHPVGETLEDVLSLHRPLLVLASSR